LNSNAKRPICAATVGRTSNGTEDKSITFKLRGEDVTFDGLTFLLHFVLPNVYFHVTTAYDILRHNGLELGKRDYLGELPR
jgi:hypothetical protein